jgi:hypothetical protein
MAITTVLDVLDKTPRYESLGYQWIDSVHFFQYNKLMMISNGPHEYVSFYQIPERRCVQSLATCGDDPRDINGCVDGAVLDQGICRCLLGLYDNLAGECKPCNGCSSCTGPETTDCTDANQLVFQIESDQ